MSTEGTEAVVELWPKLGFSRIGELDYWVPQYDAEWAAEAARRLLAGEPLGPMQYGAALFFQRAADMPAVLKEINHYLERAPSSLRQLNIAVHYLARQELVGKRQAKRVLAYVAKAWRIKESTVKDAVTDRGRDAKAALEELLRFYLTRPGVSASRSDALQKIDADMCFRATLSWFTAREKPKRSKKSVNSSGFSPPTLR
jgi:hypothetical protein